tara:strand:+ start:5665 stop:6387 length:723 start_codon:yes stop_codon:yes gene_type:complete
MSWNGTVTCSYCHESGHNKAGCSRYTAKIEEWRAAGCMGIAVRRYDAKKERKQTSAKNRKCSWCSETTHNRRTCPAYKVSFAAFQGAQAQYTRDYVKALAAGGLTPGSMFHMGLGEHANPNPHIIATVDWDRIIWWQKRNYTLRYLSADQLGTGYRGRQFSPLDQLRGQSRDRTHLTVVVPGNEASFLQSVPKDIWNGSRATKEYFKENAKSWHMSAENFCDWFAGNSESVKFPQCEGGA